jgi:hypothetical protein
MKKKSVLMYLCVILAGILSGLCIPSSWYSTAAHKTIAQLAK